MRKLKKLNNQGKPFLDANGNEVVKSFKDDHAERLLSMPKCKWQEVLEKTEPKKTRKPKSEETQD